ncbi:MAG TPA: hypothetical protein DEA73_01945 [Peptococcaceae bacterium]|nr:MAG: hypothetical protein XD51_0663 [Moorella sp. 60_41]HBT46634.1 hypothetical protein [Peptococcaceae bacterium]
MESGNRRFLLFPFILLILAAGGAAAVLGPKTVNREMSDSPAGSRSAGPVPVVERIYRDCGHREGLPLPAGVDWGRAGKEELEEAFPPEEGWTLRQEGGGRIVISQEVPGLCPADAGKFHLAELDGWVAVYRGPAGASGLLEKVLDVEISRLPVYWQERIRAGTAEFSSEEELGQALDSLDEYSGAYGP